MHSWEFLYPVLVCLLLLLDQEQKFYTNVQVLLNYYCVLAVLSKSLCHSCFVCL